MCGIDFTTEVSLYKKQPQGHTLVISATNWWFMELGFNFLCPTQGNTLHIHMLLFTRKVGA